MLFSKRVNTAISVLVVLTVVLIPFLSGSAIASSPAFRPAKITINDLNITDYANTDIQNQTMYNTAVNSGDVQMLILDLQNNGYKVEGVSEARIIKIPKLKNAEIQNIMLNITHNGENVGNLIFIKGPAKSSAYSLIKHGESDNIQAKYVENNKVYAVVFSSDGKNVISTNVPASAQSVVIPQNFHDTCMAICNIICGAGFYGDMVACMAECTASGPGWPGCTALCIAITGVGCYVGCAVICSLA